MMKLKSLIVFVLMAAASVAAASPVRPSSDDGILRILAIGNSFSRDAVEQYLYELFEASGQEAIIGNMYIPGCPLERHFKNSQSGEGQYEYRKIDSRGKTEYSGISLLEGLQDEAWDVISLQQASGKSGIYQTYVPYLPDLIEFIEKNATNRDFKLAWHMTWSYSGDSDHGDFPKYDRDQKKMYESIVSATRSALSDNPEFDLLIPSGTAIQNGRRSYLGDTFNRDGYHLDLTYGRFTAACTWYEAISGNNVCDNDYIPSSMDWREAAVAKNSSHQAVLCPYSEYVAPESVDLSGTWRFQTDVMDFRRGSLSPRYCHALQSEIILPGITDDYGIGYENNYVYVDRLTRLREYMAPAWYQRDIVFPSEWKGKRILLSMERTHWLSSVWIDKNEVSSADYISVPHVHDITDAVTPSGAHRVTIMIDNRFQYKTHKWDHSHSEFTQINWNGILGDFRLTAVDPVYLDDLQVYPDITSGCFTARIDVANHTGMAYRGTASFEVISPDGQVFRKTVPVSSESVSSVFETRIDLGKKIFLWDEFTPDLYHVKCTLNTVADGLDYSHSKETDFGMREVGREGHHITLNGHPIHLRGTVENAVFPKTGHAPVDIESWERIMSICKNYGLNHVRFHSWCPPEAAFRAADKAGVYLEIEMPMWGKDAEPDQERYDFFRREIRAILKEYGNHPSFLLYCNGNEIQGDFNFVEELTATGISLDSRHLYSGSTARNRVPSDQYYICQDTPEGAVKVYEGRPGTDWDVNAACRVDVPVISHESGQRCMYPDFRETGKYDGPVRARNLELWQRMLQENGMGDQALDFFRASGALTVLEYKAVMEALLRSSDCAGFQLLSLNDFTGQGYAPVGILDPFWDSKGLIAAEEFRRFCSPQTVLLRYDRSTWYSDETFSAAVELYNYTPESLKHADVKWSISDDSGNVLKKGSSGKVTFKSYQVSPAGHFEIPLADLGLSGPQRLTVTVAIGGKTENSWNIWVYPRACMPVSDTDVIYAESFTDSVKDFLRNGGTVVLTPRPDSVEGRRSTFHNHFWNPIMFAWPPMTLGCLMDSESHVFDMFPTSFHTDWQWWDILEYSKVIDLQDAPEGLRPFIQVIDSFDSNRKLGIGLEAKVEAGKIIILPVDLETDIEIRPAAIQLLRSIDHYVHSADFCPEIKLNVNMIKKMFR